jgi:hypothetical protein
MKMRFGLPSAAAEETAASAQEVAVKRIRIIITLIRSVHGVEREPLRVKRQPLLGWAGFVCSWCKPINFQEKVRYVFSDSTFVFLSVPIAASSR